MQNFRRAACLAGVALISSLFLSNAVAAPNRSIAPHPGKIEKPSVNGAYFVSYETDMPRSELVKTIHKAGGKVKFRYQHQNVVAAYIPFENIDLIKSAAGVTRIVPDRLITAIGKPEGKGKKPPKNSDGEQITPKGVARIGADLTVHKGEGVGIAIVDTGIDFTHADLHVNPDCFTAYAACDDDHGHGTHVAGIAAAKHNGLDVVGVAPEATLYSVKVLDANGSGHDSKVLAGLEWVYNVSDGVDENDVSPPIRVVNMSLGRSGHINDGSPLQAAISNLTNLGISVVVAAGNDPTLEVSQNVPATYPEVMAVASTTAADGRNKCRSLRGYAIQSDTASYFSTDGKLDPVTGIGVTISAPGEDLENISGGCYIQPEGILSTKIGGGTTRKYGTSMAAPHVAGAVAVMWSKALATGGALDPEQARQTIRDTAEHIGDAPFDSPASSYSFDGEREGIINLPAAMDAM